MSSGNINEIKLKARGKSITNAVDVAEIARNRFLKNWTIKNIAIGTTELPAKEEGLSKNYLPCSTSEYND